MVNCDKSDNVEESYTINLGPASEGLMSSRIVGKSVNPKRIGVPTATIIAIIVSDIINNSPIREPIWEVLAPIAQMFSLCPFYMSSPKQFFNNNIKKCFSTNQYIE